MRAPGRYRRRTSAAEAVRPLIEAALGADLAIRVRCWDGSAFGPARAGPGHPEHQQPRALRRLVRAPGELGFVQSGQRHLLPTLNRARSAQ